MLKLNFKVAPSAKPEVHYNYKTALLSAEDQAAAMGSLSCNENFLEFGRQVFEIGEWQTGRHGNTYADSNTSQQGTKVCRKL